MGVDNMSEESFRSLMPYASRKLTEAKGSPDLGFVHYTSAEAALNILNSREVWFRNSSTMNDYSEVEYGLERLAEAWNSPIGSELKELLNSFNSGAVDQLVNFHNGWQADYSEHTYLFAVSEHLPQEDDYGRLSMWREYARRSGVALVLNRQPFESDTNLLKAYTVPVMYADAAKFAENFSAIRDAVRERAHEFANLIPEALWPPFFQAFRFMSLSTKHPGFSEELEWRVVYNPSFEDSPFFKERIVTIGGVPQRIHALGLAKIEEDGEVLDLSPNALIKKIIVGPTLHQSTIKDALIAALEIAGVEDAEDKVTTSDIPVRV